MSAKKPYCHCEDSYLRFIKRPAEFQKDNPDKRGAFDKSYSEDETLRFCHGPKHKQSALFDFVSSKRKVVKPVYDITVVKNENDRESPIILSITKDKKAIFAEKTETHIFNANKDVVQRRDSWGPPNVEQGSMAKWTESSNKDGILMPGTDFFNTYTVEFQTESGEIQRKTVWLNPVDCYWSDEFPGVALDTDKWTTSGTGTVAVSAGAVSIQETNETDTKISADADLLASFCLTSIQADRQASVFEAWVASTVYALNARVLAASIGYKCLAAHTSGSSFAVTQWQAVNSWASSTAYAVGARIHSGSTTAKCSYAHTSGSVYATTQWQYQTSWATSTAYALNATRRRPSGNMIKCLNAHTSGSVFSLTAWAAAPAWQTVTAYSVGDPVNASDAGSTFGWICINAHTSAGEFPEGGGLNWEYDSVWSSSTSYSVDDSAVDHYAWYSVGYVCTNAHTSGTEFAITLWEATGTTWAASTAYTTATRFSNGYKCVNAHTSGPTFSTSHWNVQSAWATSTAYVVNNTVGRGSAGGYKCVNAHTSGSAFAVSHWQVDASGAPQERYETGIKFTSGADDYWIIVRTPGALATTKSIEFRGPDFSDLIATSGDISLSDDEYLYTVFKIVKTSEGILDVYYDYNVGSQKSEWPYYTTWTLLGTKSGAIQGKVTPSMIFELNDPLGGANDQTEPVYFFDYRIYWGCPS